MTPYLLAQRYFREFKQHGDEIIPTYCPFCKGGTNRDKYTFAMNAIEGTYNCKRGNCDVSGSFYQLCKYFGETPLGQQGYEYLQPKKKNYKKPQTQIKQLSPQVADYLRLRGISQATCEACRIGDDGKGNIVFPYYKNGNLVMVKFRPAKKLKKGEKKAWREKGGKPVFWLMDNCIATKPLIITEGELDAAVLRECGFENAVSLPSGAEDLTCIDLCWDWLEKFKKIIIWTDNDEPGIQCRENLIKRLGAGRCAVVNHKRKDANEVLVLDGKSAVVEAVKNAVDVPIEGLIRLADVANFDPAKTLRVRSGFSGIDKEVGGYHMGELTVWTGINGSGKSTFLSQTMIEAVNQGYSVCAYSGELPAPIFRYWIDLQAAGPGYAIKQFDEIKQKEVSCVNPDIVPLIHNWYRDKFYLYDSKGIATEDGIVEIFTYAIQRYDCKVFLVDNLMTVLLNGKDSDFYRNQGKFVGRVKEFAKNNQVHVHLVAHPKKTIGRLNKMDVSGTGDITNLADNVLGVHRLSKKEKQEYEDDPPDVLIDIFKNRLYGSQDVEIELIFDDSTKRFAMAGEPGALKKKYGWDKLEYDFGEEMPIPANFLW